MCKLKNEVLFPSLGSKAIAEMQIFRKHNSRLPWTLTEKHFAIHLYYKSTTTYKYLRKYQQIILPSETTDWNLIGNSKFCPGFNSLRLKQIKNKLNTMSNEEKYCVLCYSI